MKLKEFFKPTITKIILALALMFIPQYNQVICGIVSCFEEKNIILKYFKTNNIFK